MNIIKCYKVTPKCLENINGWRIQYVIAENYLDAYDLVNPTNPFPDHRDTLIVTDLYDIIATYPITNLSMFRVPFYEEDKEGRKAWLLSPKERP